MSATATPNLFKTLFYGTAFAVGNMGIGYWLFGRDLDTSIVQKRIENATCRPYLNDYLTSLGFGKEFDSIRDPMIYRRVVFYHDCLGKELERYGYKYGYPKEAAAKALKTFEQEMAELEKK
jgi:hypothetical protein